MIYISQIESPKESANSNFPNFSITSDTPTNLSAPTVTNDGNKL